MKQDKVSEVCQVSQVLLLVYYDLSYVVKRRKNIFRYHLFPFFLS